MNCFLFNMYLFVCLIPTEDSFGRTDRYLGRKSYFLTYATLSGRNNATV